MHEGKIFTCKFEVNVFHSYFYIHFYQKILYFEDGFKEMFFKPYLRVLTIKLNQKLYTQKLLIRM